jgi:hypothetical protein
VSDRGGSATGAAPSASSVAPRWCPQHRGVGPDNLERDLRQIGDTRDVELHVNRGVALIDKEDRQSVVDSSDRQHPNVVPLLAFGFEHLRAWLQVRQNLKEP